MTVTRADAELPQLCRGANCQRATPGLQLSVTLTRAGAIVATSEGVLAADCASTAAGRVTLPSAEGAIEFEALATCLATVHERHPDEREMILSADPEIPYEALIAAMDAAREGPTGVMFPEVRLSAGVR